MLPCYIPHCPLGGVPRLQAFWPRASLSSDVVGICRPDFSNVNDDPSNVDKDMLIPYGADDNPLLVSYARRTGPCPTMVQTGELGSIPQVAAKAFVT